MVGTLYLFRPRLVDPVVNAGFQSGGCFLQIDEACAHTGTYTGEDHCRSTRSRPEVILELRMAVFDGKELGRQPHSQEAYPQSRHSNWNVK